MPDKQHDDLERELRGLRPRIEYPPTPDVARTVRRSLDAEASRRTGRNIWGRMLARPGWAAAAAVTILLSLVALAPAMRSVSDSASSDGAGGGGAGQAAGGGGAAGGVAEEDAAPAGDLPASSSEYAIEEGASSGGQGASGGAAAGYGMPPGGALGLGERLSTPEVRARVGDLLVPDGVLAKLGVGAENYVCDEAGVMCAAGGTSEGDGVVLVFRPGRGLAPLGDTDVGLVLVETPGGMDVAYGVPGERASGARPEEVVVGGGRGFWFPDGRLLRPQPGQVGSLAGGALVWEREDVALLIRADVTKQQAVRIAETVR